MNSITAIILARNEEVNIERCISSIKGLADRIVVVDSGSTDRTMDIARQMGAEVYEHPFEHYASQFNWALDNVSITTTWVYRIDADEAVTDELRKEIIKECKEHLTDDVNGFLMKHKLHFLGRDLIHGGAYPFIKMTVFKHRFARFDDRPMGEHVVLSEGTYRLLENDCVHYDFKNLTAFINKHNDYATREVLDYFARIGEKQLGLYDQAERTKRIRDGFYYRLPMFFRAKLYYWYRYYIRLGFLDGTPGRIYAFLQAYMYRYIVDAKLYESKISKKGK
jgi:glycosyltransferase involved in cell wall biosynthesis